MKRYHKYSVFVLLLLAGCRGGKDFDYRESMFPKTSTEAMVKSSFSKEDSQKEVTEKEKPLEEPTTKKSGSSQNSDTAVTQSEKDSVQTEKSEVKFNSFKEKAEEKKEENSKESKSIKEEKIGEQSNQQQSQTPSFPNRVLESDYSGYSNETLNWWYHVPKPLHQEIPAKINKEVRELVQKYDALWQYPTGDKKIYWTMDEGYEFEENTTTILNVAKEKGVPITFFVTGDFIRQRPDLLKRMDAEGHLICNHSNKHMNSPKALSESNEKWIWDVTKVEEMVLQITGKEIRPYFRPPEGAYSERVLKILKDLGYRAVFWSFAYKDWETKNQPEKKYAKDKILGQLHDGSILLIHAVSATNVAIFSELIDEIRARGFTFDTIDNIPAFSPDGY